MSVLDAIASSVHVPIRRLYIKRKLVSGDYETDWQRVDMIDGIDQVVQWGSISYEIDSDPSTSDANFDISSITMQLVNDLGLWNNEKSTKSMFYPDDVYLTRKFTKIKIEAAYIDEDYEEQGTCTIFEGFIESVSTSQDRTASIKAMSYLYLLKNYPISDREYTQTPMLVSEIIDDIFGLDKVSDFIFLETNSPGLDSTIQDPSQLSGDYWQVIQQLAFLSASVPVLLGEVVGSESDGQVFKFVPREALGDVKRTFRGGTHDDADIYSINSYDDEGAKRVVLRWRDSDSGLFAKSSDAKLAMKYLDRTSEVDLTLLDIASIQPLLDELLSYWEQPRENLTFTCKMMLNIINVMDKISVDIPKVYPANAWRWGFGNWGDAQIVGSESKAGVYIYRKSRFLVTMITSNLDDWTSVIRAERI